MAPVLSTDRTARHAFRFARCGVLDGHRIKPHLEWLDTFTILGSGLWNLIFFPVWVLTIQFCPIAKESPYFDVTMVLMMVGTILGFWLWNRFATWILLRFIRPLLMGNGILTPEEAEWYPLESLGRRYRPTPKWRHLWKFWGEHQRTPWPLEWQERIATPQDARS